MRGWLKDRIGWLLGYGSCPTCGRTMWRMNMDEWVTIVRASGPNWSLGRLVCREHRR